MISFISILLGVLGLAGVMLTALMYVNPRLRVDYYLRKPRNWEKITLDLNGMHSIWRYKNHPEFTIEKTDDEQEWSYDKRESWMKYPLPDPSKYTKVYLVKAGGVIVYVEHFITLDGGRYLVPLPRVSYHSEKEIANEYYYTTLQVRLAQVIGTFYRMKDIHEFIRHNEIEVRGGGGKK